MEFVAVVLLIVVGIVAVSVLRNQARRKRLMEKYGDETVVDRIMRKMMWQGMSSDQLRHSLGPPVAVDRKVYKSKITETYKYAPSGKNRFRCRVKVENDVVVGWEQKQGLCDGVVVRPRLQELSPDGLDLRAHVLAT